MTQAGNERTDHCRKKIYNPGYAFFSCNINKLYNTSLKDERLVVQLSSDFISNMIIF